MKNLVLVSNGRRYPIGPWLTIEQAEAHIALGGAVVGVREGRMVLYVHTVSLGPAHMYDGIVWHPVLEEGS